MQVWGYAWIKQESIFTQILLTQVSHKLVYPQSTTRGATFCLAQKALAACPAGNICQVPREVCATDTADKDIANTQTDSPSALCDFTTHSLRPP